MHILKKKNKSKNFTQVVLIVRRLKSVCRSGCVSSRKPTDVLFEFDDTSGLLGNVHIIDGTQCA